MFVLTSVMGFEPPPSWQAVAEGARPETQPPDDLSQVVFAQVGSISERSWALIHSQAGPGAGVALRVPPTSSLTSIQPHLFRVVLLWRLRLLLSLPVRSCRCGRAIDIFGHHRAACARAVFWGAGELH